MPKVAAVQMCSSTSVDANLRMVATLVAKASEQGAGLVVLPEMFATIGQNVADKITIQEKFGLGKIQDFLAATAEKHNIWIVGGTIPISCDDPNKTRAACIVYNAEGKVAARYDKVHLFDVVISESECYQESATIQAGNKLAVVDTPVGKVGLAVCYDIRFPGLFTHLFNQGAEIFAIPAAFTVKTGQAHWQLLTRSRAVENFCYVIGATQGGEHANGRKTYGHALIVDPWGCVVAEKADMNPGVIYAEIDLDNLHKIRASLPIAEHQRIFPDVSKL